MLENSDVTLLCVIGVDPDIFDLEIIPHFIEHYRSIGVKNFDIIINADSEEKMTIGKEMLKKLNIDYTTWIGSYDANAKTAIVNSHQKIMKTKWCLIVDSDEFIKITSIQNLIVEVEKVNKLHVRGEFIDRFAKNKVLNTVLAKPSIWDQFPLEERVTGNVIKDRREKTFLIDVTKLYSSSGNHDGILWSTKKLIYNVDLYPKIFDVAHFKWTSTVQKRIQKRYEKYSANPEQFTWHPTLLRCLNYIDGLKNKSNL